MAQKRKHASGKPPAGPARADGKAGAPRQPGLRIVGGEFRGRHLDVPPTRGTRPMKDNIREALFNLAGGWIPGTHAFDLFAGSGAVGLEALSRGATHATFIERHFPAAQVIRRNIEHLGVSDRCTVVTSDTFFWARQFLSRADDHPAVPWSVFCCPPYDLYVSQETQVLALIESLLAASPPDSLFVVESDERFDPARLPDADKWRARQYTPARICVWRPPGKNRPPDAVEE